MPLVLSMWRDMPGTPSEGDVQETSHTDVQGTSAGSAPLNVEVKWLYSELLTLLREEGF